MIVADRPTPTLVVRQVTQRDARSILRLLKGEWRVHLRVLPADVDRRLRTILGMVVEDRVGLRGFLLLEPQPAQAGLVIGAGVHDNWTTARYLDLLLPALEAEARRVKLTALSQVGHAPWLTGELLARGFDAREWIVTYEWQGNQPPATDPSFTLRTAHRRDLPALVALDRLAFHPAWHKPMINFRDALARAISFSVIEVGGQVAGYQWSDKIGEYGHLTRLATHPDYQGQGIGRALVAQSLRGLLRAGARKITLNTQETNTRSQALYERCGFAPVNQRVAVLWKDLA
jgi:[ribosomal protein S18]-alanine N-acetyltransferase